MLGLFIRSADKPGQKLIDIRVDVTVASFEGSSNGGANLATAGLPGAETNCRYLCTSIELERLFGPV